MTRSERHVDAVPPGPPLPQLLQTLGLLFLRAPFVEASRRRYGDMVTFRTLFDSGFVMVFDPEAVRQVFRAPPAQARAGKANAGVEPLHGTYSLLALDGAEHLRQRRLMLPSFHGERMGAYETVMREAADRAIDAWPVGKPFALLPWMYSLTLDVIMRAVFGVEEGQLPSELNRRVRAMLDPVDTGLSRLLRLLCGGRLGTAGARRFDQRHRAVDELIYEEISRRRASSDLERRADVLSTLLLARDEAGRTMTDAELHDELVTLLVAGHETTATSLAWAFELLLRNPGALERLRAALAAGEEDYLDAVVKETLRLRPAAAGIGRLVCEEPLEVGGYLIPPGMEISPSIAGIHRRADRYPEPHAFRPERFLGPDAPDAHAWLPFGGGTRRCLGASFAMLEMRTVIRRVLERTRLRAVGRRPERSVRRGVTPPTPHALGRSLRRDRRPIPKRGARVVQSVPPSKRVTRSLTTRSSGPPRPREVADRSTSRRDGGGPQPPPPVPTPGAAG